MSASKIKKLDEKQRKNKGMTSVISSLVRIWKICHSYPGYIEDITWLCGDTDFSVDNISYE